MLYYLFEYLDKTLDVPGAGVFQYITFRSALALILSLMISTIYGKKVITFLRNQQVGERTNSKSRIAKNGRFNHHFCDFNSGFVIDKIE